LVKIESEQEFFHKCTKCETVFSSNFEDLISGCPICKNMLFKLIIKKNPVDNSKRVEDNVNHGKKSENNAQNFEKKKEVKQGEEAVKEACEVEGIKILEPGVYLLDINKLVTEETIVLEEKEGVFRIAIPYAKK
jgi:predicted  nucleic acid-binding Zn-ribbon protein